MNEISDILLVLVLLLVYLSLSIGLAVRSLTQGGKTTQLPLWALLTVYFIINFSWISLPTIDIGPLGTLGMSQLFSVGPMVLLIAILVRALSVSEKLFSENQSTAPRRKHSLYLGILIGLFNYSLGGFLLNYELSNYLGFIAISVVLYELLQRADLRAMNALKHAALLGLGEALTSFLFLFPFIFGMPDGYHVEIFSFASALTLASGMFYSLIIMFIFLIFFGRMKEKPKGEEDIYQ